MGIFEIFKKKKSRENTTIPRIPMIPVVNSMQNSKSQIPNTPASSPSKIPVIPVSYSKPEKKKFSPTDLILNTKSPLISKAVNIVAPNLKSKIDDQLIRKGSAMAAGVASGVGSIADVGGFALRQQQKLIDKVAKPIPKAVEFVDKRPLLKKTLEALGPDVSREAVIKPYTQLSENIEKKAGITPENKDYWEKVAGSFGFMLPSTALSFATGGIGGAVLGGGLEAASNAQDVYDTLKADGVDEKTANKRAAATFGSNILLNTVTNKLGYLSDGIKGPFKKYITSVLMELGQEDAQQVISNIATGRPWKEGIAETTLLALPQTLLLGAGGVISDNVSVNNREEYEKAKEIENIILNGDPAFKKQGVEENEIGKSVTDSLGGGRLIGEKRDEDNFYVRQIDSDKSYNNVSGVDIISKIFESNPEITNITGEGTVDSNGFWKKIGAELNQEDYDGGLGARFRLTKDDFNKYKESKSTKDSYSQDTKSPLRQNESPIGKKADTEDILARERFNIPELEKVSFGGSDRDVYDLGDGNVLKIVKSARGLDQNAFSADYYAEDAGLIPKTVEVGKNYIVKEKVLPPDDNVKNMLREIDVETSGFVARNDYQKQDKIYEILDKYGYNADALRNYSPLWGDMIARRNWGTTKEGKPIMLDEGTLNSDFVSTGYRAENVRDFNLMKNQSRIVKKQFGDTDKKTAYKISDKDSVNADTKNEALAKQKLQEYKDRLKLDFDVNFVDNILTEEGDLAQGVTYDSSISIAKNVSKFVADHEVMHLVFRNLNKIPAFRSFKRSELYKAVQKTYPEIVQKPNESKQDYYLRLEEQLASDFELYVAEKENSKKFPKQGIIDRFFSALYKQLKSMFSLGKTNLEQIQDFYETLYEGKAKTQTKLKSTGLTQQRMKDGVLSFREGDAAAYKEAYDQSVEKVFTEQDAITYIADIADSFEEGSMSRKAAEAWAEQLDNARGELDIYEPGGKIVMYSEREGGVDFDMYRRTQATGLNELAPEDRRNSVVFEVRKALKERKRPQQKKAAELYDHVISKYFNYLEPEYQNEIASLMTIFVNRKLRNDKAIKQNLNFAKKNEAKPLTSAQTKKAVANILYSGLANKKFTVSEKKLFAEKVKNLNAGFKTGMKLGAVIEAINSNAKLDTQKRKAELAVLKAGMKGRAQGEQAGIVIGNKQGKNIRENIISELKRGFALKDMKSKILMRETQKVRALMRQYIQEKLPIAERGRFLAMVTSAKTRADLARAFGKVDNRLNDYLKKEIITDIRKVAARINESGRVAIEHKSIVQKMLSRFNMSKLSDRKRNEFEKTREYIQRERAKGNDPYMPQYVYDNLKILDRKNIKDLSVNELKNIQMKLNIILSTGKSRLRSREEIYEAEKSEKQKELLESIVPIEKSALLEAVPGTKLSNAAKFKNVFPKMLNVAQHMNLATMPMDVRFDIMDGSPGTFQGPASRIFKGTIDTAWGNYLTDLYKYTEPVHDLANKLNMNEQNFERIGIHAAKMQSDGNQKLLNTGLTQEYIDSIELTDSEKQMYDAMRKVFEDLYPTIAEVTKNIYNKPVGKVDNYFSYMTDFSRMSEAEIFKRFGQETPEFGMPTKNVDKSFTEARTGAGDQKIKLNAMTIFNNHVDNATYMINMARDAKMLSEIANTDAFEKKAGELGARDTREWLDLVVRKGGKGGTEGSRFLDVMRKNIGPATLGFKLSSAIIQPTALIDGASIIGSDAFRGALEVGTSKEIRKFIIDNMPEIKSRVGDDIAFLEFGDQGVLSSARKASMWLLKRIDGVTASSVAWGAYTKKLAEMGVPLDMKKPNKEAVDYAQSIVRRTQSSSAFKDAPLALTRGGLTGNISFDKAILQFQLFMLNRWHKTKYNFWDIGIRQKRFDRAFGQIFWLALALLAEEGLRRASKELIGAVTGEKPEYKDDYTDAVSKSALGVIPFLGQAMSIATFGGDMIPGLNMISDTVRSVKPAFSGKTPETRTRGKIDVISGVGTALGIPGSRQAGDIAKQLIVKSTGSKTKSSSTKNSVGTPKIEIPQITVPRIEVPKIKVGI